MIMSMCYILLIPEKWLSDSPEQPASGPLVICLRDSLQKEEEEEEP
jgi:hypothetical protein